MWIERAILGLLVEVYLFFAMVWYVCKCYERDDR